MCAAVRGPQSHLRWCDCDYQSGSWMVGVGGFLGIPAGCVADNTVRGLSTRNSVLGMSPACISFKG